MKSNKKWYGCLGVFLLLSVLVACQQAGSPPSGQTGVHASQHEDDDALEEVTIRIMSQNPFDDDESFETYYVEPLAEVYPHITLERVEGGNLEDMILADELPDIITSWNGNIAQYIGMEVVQDLHPYVEMANSDLDRFVYETIDAVSVDDKLYGLPYAQQFEALYYNKDIFDRFGVNYPEDGMTWQDTIQLAAQVTQEEDGVQYRGLDPHMFGRLLNPFGLGSFLDYKTNESIIPERRDDLTRVFEVWRDIYSIPGNLPEDRDVMNQGGAANAFMEGELAMLAAVNIAFNFPDELNWDVAQYPMYEHVPDTYGAVDAHYHFLTTTSEHPQDAFRVMDFFSSPEHQERLTRELGLFTVMQDPEIIRAFASEHPIISQIDFSGVFKSSAAPSPILHEIRLDLRRVAQDRAFQMLDDGTDINTLIDEIEQEVDIMREEYVNYH